MKKVLGITGTIASGKSTVCAYLREHYDVLWIDADRVGHEVLDDRPVTLLLTKTFGNDILKNGFVDRKALGQIVFSDPRKLSVLNAITHPVICRKIAEQVEAFRKKETGPHFCVIEAIELLRSDLKDLLDDVWVVWADDEIRVQRVMARDGLCEADARERLAKQWPQENYKACADVCIDGGQELSVMLASVDAEMRHYLEH